MTSFRYTALAPSGRLTRGVMEAPDETAVLRRLRSNGHLPIQATPYRGRTVADLLRLEIGGTGLRRQEIANLTRELATMLGAGQDLDRALRFLVETAPNARVAGQMATVRATVRDGAQLATALGQNRSFTPLYLGMVRAGEAGGTLAVALEQLAVLQERERSLVANVTTALVYPGVLLAAAILSIVLLLTQVLPQFVPLFEQSGAAMPWPTRLLIAAGDAVAQYGLWGMVALALIGLGVRQALSRPAPRRAADLALLRMPLFGALAREVLAARLTRTLGTLLTNGVPLLAALAVTRDVVVNRAGQDMLDRAAVAAKAGAGLSGALADAALLPPRTVHLLRLGEETAQLGPMALRAAGIHEEATRLGVQRLVALLVPGITIVMGAVVGGIVAALLLAMLGLNDLTQ